MNSIYTKFSRPSQRRGTAEIELLLCVLLIITLLFLVTGILKFSRGLLLGSASAREAAFHDAMVTANPLYAPDSAPTQAVDTNPLPGYSTQRLPQLPVRLHVPRFEQEITTNYGSGKMPTITIKNSAAVPSPAWALNAYPVPSDQAITEAWFESYIDESLGSIRGPLDLAPAWIP